MPQALKHFVVQTSVGLAVGVPLTLTSDSWWPYWRPFAPFALGALFVAGVIIAIRDRRAASRALRLR